MFPSSLLISWHFRSQFEDPCASSTLLKVMAKNPENSTRIKMITEILMVMITQQKITID